ncbi:MAG: sulfite exporter TauE/SafE family protein [Lachnospiraceae bacterium]|nr:sulfite exporter TauE/SafE family protein [Lachnospiraceae bacterium]
MWLWIIATFSAFFIKGLCGFANTLIFSSIMAFNANNINISPVELLLGYPANITLVLKNRKSLKKSVFIPLTILVLLGCIPGALLLKNVNVRFIKLLFGAVVILIAIELLLRELNVIKLKTSKLVLGIIGLLSGVLCGLFGIGAPLAAYVSRVTASEAEFKANISAVFISENTFRIILYSVIGIITLPVLKQALLLIPVMAAGLLLGMLCSKLFKDRVIKILIVILLIISGIVMIIRNI